MALAVVGGFIVLIGELIKIVRRRRGEDEAIAFVRQTTDEVIREVRVDEADFEAQALKLVEDAVVSEGHSDWIDNELVAGMVQTKVNDVVAAESPMRLEAEAAIQDWLPRIPRRAIRLVNRLRFSISVAAANHLFDVGVTGAQVGKWALLSERWQMLAWDIALEPDLLGSLEDLTDDEDAFGEKLKEFPPEAIPDSEELRRFLLSGEKLGEFALQLVHLEPDPNSIDSDPAVSPRRGVDRA